MANITLKLRPLTVPKFVTYEELPQPRQEGFNPQSGRPIYALDDSTIDVLLREFCENVWADVRAKRRSTREAL